MPSRFRRVIWIVLDGVGLGAMPDAAEYGDEDSDTLRHIATQYHLELPFLQQLGLGNIIAVPHLMPVDRPPGAFGKCALLSPGKDSTTGHWEMAGIILERPFPLFPQGFPPAIVRPFEEAIGRSILGNKAASGTKILEELGDLHCRTGSPIVYTSADSVFQVAAHENVIPTEQLHSICEKARALLAGDYEVARVIARPFKGEPGHFERTPGRRDYSVPPPAGMLLDQLRSNNAPVIAIGKIADLFDGRSIDRSNKTKNNADGMATMERVLSKERDGLIWLNLVDFDQLFGHRNDVIGYAKALEIVDAWLPTLPLNHDDLVVITADHGCDPTTHSTDHSREYTPLIVYGDCVRAGVALGTRSTLADIGQTVAQNFGCTIAHGQSFLQQIWKG